MRSSALCAPWFFFDPILENACGYWAAPRIAKPGVVAMQALEVLMVQSLYDVATPTEGANHFFAQMPKARRVVVPGECQHGVFPYSDTCVDDAVVRYLLGETPKEHETSCQAKLLEQHTRAEPQLRSLQSPKQCQKRQHVQRLLTARARAPILCRRPTLILRRPGR